MAATSSFRALPKVKPIVHVDSVPGFFFVGVRAAECVLGLMYWETDETRLAKC